MLWVIIKKEFLGNIKTLKFIWSFLLCLLLMGTSSFIRTTQYNQRITNYHANVKLHLKTAGSYSAYRDLAEQGIKIDRPADILSIFVEGLENNLPGVFSISSSSESVVGIEKNWLFSLFGTIDYLFVISTIMSLVAILFTYDAICGEKERGTLKLLLSNPIPKDLLLWGKVLGGYLTLLFPVTVSFLLGLLIVNIICQTPFSAYDFSRLGLIFIISLIYLGTFCNLGLFVSSVTVKSSTALLVLLLIWLVLVFLIPNLSPLLASSVYPVTPMQKIMEEKRNTIETAWEKFEEKYAKYDEEYGGVPLMDKGSVWMIERDKEITEEIEKIENPYQLSLNQQLKLSMNISRLSPVSSFFYTISHLAQTDYLMHLQIMAMLKKYKQAFIEYVNRMMIEEDSPIPDLLNKIDITEMPQFVMKKPPLIELINNIQRDIFLLISWLVILFVTTYFTFLKYDIR
ncbi:MAG: ABC transporter permease subunit [bacterium]